MTENPYILAREFKETVKREFFPRLCSPRINWLGEYLHFLEENDLTEGDIPYEKFMKI